MWIYRECTNDSQGLLDMKFEIGYFDQETDQFISTRETRTRTEAEKIVSRLNGGANADSLKFVLGIAAVTFTASYIMLQRAKKHRKKSKRISFFR